MLKRSLWKSIRFIALRKIDLVTDFDWYSCNSHAKSCSKKFRSIMSWRKVWCSTCELEKPLGHCQAIKVPERQRPPKCDLNGQGEVLVEDDSDDRSANEAVAAPGRSARG